MESTSFQKGKMLERIMKKRSVLKRLVAENGLKSKKVLKCSQELDLLIYQIQVLDKQEIEKNFCQYQ